MLIDLDRFLFVYPISRDFRFAPNPFHGVCTLATCKPRVRKAANVGDWVMGVGGTSLSSVCRKCIFLMKVTEKMEFQEYWDDPQFSLKKPVRNGSRVQMLGDNIYHRSNTGEWIQEDSHHSNPDGSVNIHNLKRDTGTCESVLVSRFYFYFGESAISVNLDAINYGRIRDFRKVGFGDCENAVKMVESIEKDYRGYINYLMSDPVQFGYSHLRVDQLSGKLH